jgi:hypothetical protein
VELSKVGGGSVTKESTVLYENLFPQVWPFGEKNTRLPDELL